MYILSSAALLCGILSFIKYKKWYNPITLFSLLWSLIFILYGLHLRDYYYITLTTEIVLLIQVISFAVGGMLGDVFAIKFKTKRAYSDQSTQLRKRVVYVFCIITIIVLFGDSVVVIHNLLQGKSLISIISQNLVTENSSTGIMVGVKFFIVYPTATVISAITAVELMLNEQTKKDWLLFVFNIAIVVLYTLQHGGRNILMIFVISYILTYAYSKRKSFKSEKLKIIIRIFCIISVLFSIWVSSSRGIDNLGNSLYEYFAGVLPHLDHYITSTSSNNYTFGISSIYGFFSPFLSLLRGVGIISQFPAIFMKASANVAAPTATILIGNNIVFNAHVGLGYAFYSDGGIPYVFLGSFIYGYICMNLYKRTISGTTTRMYSLYILILCTVCTSFIRFAFVSYMYAVGVLLLLIFYKRGKDSNDNIEHEGRTWKSNV